jgi:hypothetical protein
MGGGLRMLTISFRELFTDENLFQQTKAGGGSQCNTISQTAFTTLLAAGGNCDQQNAADSMIDLAKTLNNDPDMIRLAQIFVQQPRNAVGVCAPIPIVSNSKRMV